MCQVDFGDGPDVWRERVATARKLHPCASCGGQVLPGDKYVRHVSIHEHEVTTEASCIPCDRDRQKLGDAHDGTPSPRYFPEMLRECVAEDDGSGRRWGRMLKRLAAREEQAKIPNA